MSPVSPVFHTEVTMKPKLAVVAERSKALCNISQLIYVTSFIFYVT